VQSVSGAAQAPVLLAVIVTLSWFCRSKRGVGRGRVKKNSRGGLAILNLSVIVDYNTSSPVAGIAPAVIEARTMPKQLPYLNEIISLIVMFLMLAALIAGQADATQALVDRTKNESSLIRADDDAGLRP